MDLPFFVDATSLFAFQTYLKDHDYPVQGNIDYSALVDAVQQRFPNDTLAPRVAFVAVSFEHEGQKRFCSYLADRLKFVVDATDYRDAFVLPDRSSPYQRLSTRLTYVAGMLADKHKHIVAVTDAFDTYYPLVDYVKARGGTVTLAFFRTALEARWQRVGLFSPDSPIRFVDLDSCAREIIGADIAAKGPGSMTSRSLADLDFTGR